jgi:hypothetical protein
LRLLQFPFRIRAGFRHTCGVAAIRISTNFPANSGNVVDASSTSNKLTTPKTAQFSGIFPDNRESDYAISECAMQAASPATSHPGRKRPKKTEEL